LITFGISHFCEKARWALDWHGIPYEEIGWPPGWIRLAKLRRLSMQGKRVKELTCNLTPRETKLDFGL
jgi:glutathione S-transferase-like protein